jgi:hypothetical protein
VKDVALQLPRKLRNDVAFELRALLGEELQAKAEVAGRSADGAMTLELLRAFGRPDEVAARYQPALTIIDPADGRRFLQALAFGLGLIWSLGLILNFAHPIGSPSDLLLAIGHWWSTTVVPSLIWPGALVVGFGLAAWARRRWPDAGQWQPREYDRIKGGRAVLALGIVGMIFGLFVLAQPTWVLDYFWNGHAAPAVYRALSYTPGFLHLQGPLLLLIVALNLPLYAAVFVKGYWSSQLRLIEAVLALLDCVVLVWTVVSGPIMQSAASDGLVKLLLVIIAASTLLDRGIRWHRSVRPMPT